MARPFSTVGHLSLASAYTAKDKCTALEMGMIFSSYEVAKCQLLYSEFQTYNMDMQCSLLNDCVASQGELASSSQLNHLYLVKLFPG